MAGRLNAIKRVGRIVADRAEQVADFAGHETVEDVDLEAAVRWFDIETHIPDYLMRVSAEALEYLVREPRTRNSTKGTAPS